MIIGPGIIGIGNDLCDIRRIETMLERYGDRFLVRVFSPDEQAFIKSRPPQARAATCAKRYAAKEACAKALGTGIASGIYLSDLSVTRTDAGKPGMVLTGGASAHLASLTPQGRKARIELTLTDEYPLAMAHVLIWVV